MTINNAAVSLIDELTDQELSGAEGAQAGGLFTFPGTYTVGYICTISWECSGFLCSSWF